MHRCNPDDNGPCNAMCHGTTHVDLVYVYTGSVRDEDMSLVDALVWRYRDHTPPCTILAVAPAPEAPALVERYPQYGGTDWAGGFAAFRVTYQVEEREQDTREEER